jgi:hypothetical protein
VEHVPLNASVGGAAMTNLERDLIRQACFDPGRFVKRERTASDSGGYDYEPLHAWQARAVVAVLEGVAAPTP